MRRAFVPLLMLATLPLVAPMRAFGGPRSQGDCGTSVPAEAQRVFDDLVSAFRAANAGSIVGLMDRSRDARLYMKLQDVPPSPYASEQARGILENTYFKKHTVTSLTETKDCPKGQGAAFTRSYLLTTKTDTAEASEHLSVRVHRIDVKDKTSYWVLESLESTLIPRK